LAGCFSLTSLLRYFFLSEMEVLLPRLAPLCKPCLGLFLAAPLAILRNSYSSSSGKNSILCGSLFSSSRRHAHHPPLTTSHPSIHLVAMRFSPFFFFLFVDSPTCDLFTVERFFPLPPNFFFRGPRPHLFGVFLNQPGSLVGLSPPFGPPPPALVPGLTGLELLLGPFFTAFGPPPPQLHIPQEPFFV